MLTRVAQDAERALRAVEQSRALGEDDGVVAARDLLRNLIGLDFDVDRDGVPRLHVGTRPGRIISTVDPDLKVRVGSSITQAMEQVRTISSPS